MAFGSLFPGFPTFQPAPTPPPQIDPRDLLALQQQHANAILQALADREAAKENAGKIPATNNLHSLATSVQAINAVANGWSQFGG